MTALSPVIGYENATDVAQEALLSGRGVAEIVEAKGLLTRGQINTLLSPEALTSASQHPSPTAHCSPQGERHV